MKKVTKNRIGFVKANEKQELKSGENKSYSNDISNI